MKITMSPCSSSKIDVLDSQSALRDNNRKQPGATDSNNAFCNVLYPFARHCRRVVLRSAQIDPVNGVIVY